MSADQYIITRNPAGPSQTVAYTGTAGTIANPLPDNAQSVQIICTTLAFARISFGAVGTAAVATDIPIAPNFPMVFPIQRPTAPGTNSKCWVSAIQSAAGGNLHVLPLAE